VSANSSCGGQGAGTGTRVHGDGLANNEAILDELADGLTGVGVGNLTGLVGVEPDLALSAADNGCGEALLRAEVDPIASTVSLLSIDVVMNNGASECAKRGSPRLGSLIERLPRIGTLCAARECLLSVDE
jgi:hypothetical protein